MDITSIASTGTAMKGNQVGQQIGVAVMKQVQDQEKQQGAALIKMIQQTNTATAAASGHVDIYA